MVSKKSETVILQGFSCVVNIIADEHNNRPGVSYLDVRPAMPEPQMHPYRVIKRYGNISRCHGCHATFDKKKTTMILFRKEIDWWPDMYILRGEWRKWRTSKRNFYYCVKLSCLMNRRPTLRKENGQLFVMERTSNLQKRLGVNFNLNHNQTKDYDMM